MAFDEDRQVQSLTTKIWWLVVMVVAFKNAEEHVKNRDSNNETGSNPML